MDTTEATIRHNIAATLRSVMESHELSQVELSRLSGVRQPCLSSYLNEQSTATIPSLVAIGQATGFTVAELLEGVEKKPRGRKKSSGRS